MIQDLAKRATKTIANNSSTILTGLAVVGAVGSAILSAEATVKAIRVIDDYEAREGRNPDFKGRVRDLAPLVWRFYVPAAASTTLTVVCIIATNRVSSRRAAVLASAYSLSEKAFSEYKEKVADQLGANKEQKIRDELAQDQVDRNPVSTKEVIITGKGDVLCYDTFTGRYFESNVEDLRKAENEVNRQILTEMYASLNDFHRLVGLPPTGLGEELGWNLDSQLDLQFSSTLSEDSKPCLAVGYSRLPVRDYHKIY